jgi:hypothetical protein
MVDDAGTESSGLTPDQETLAQRLAAAAADLHEDIREAARRDEVLIAEFLDDGRGAAWSVRLHARPRAELVAEMPKVAAPAPVRDGEVAACWVIATSGRALVCVRLGAVAAAVAGQA